jgi:dTMP kinase
MGLLITIEGGEFVGKTSVVTPFLKSFFEKKKIKTLVSREPGGTPEGERYRQLAFQLLKEGAHTEKIAECMYKARRILIKTILIPFLGPKKENNVVVILDRYLDSSRIYQGYLGGLSQERIKELDNEYVKGYYPDLTLILYFPEDVFEKTFLERQQLAEKTAHQRDKNNWDEEEIEKHLKRQRLYLTLPELAKRWKENRDFLLINAAQDPTKVKKEIKKKLTAYLKNHLLTR